MQYNNISNMQSQQQPSNSQNQQSQLQQQMSKMTLQQQTRPSVPVQPTQPILQIGRRVKQSKNNSFTPNNTIIPITRTISINQYCYAIYSTLHKVPLAVHQFLDKSIVQGSAVRDGKDFVQQQDNVESQDLKFYVDSSYYDKTGAYKNMSYDKGHMAPAKNYCAQQRLMDSTYTYANCIPQNSYFNRGSWKNLQSYCRKLVRDNMCDTVEVISGPVFYSNIPYERPKQKTKIENLFKNEQMVMLENGLVVPPKCYKIIKANVGNQSYLAAFVMPNQEVKDNQIPIKDCLVPMESLEYMTGLRFNLSKYYPLEDLDPTGMAKTFGDLNLEFYTKLFKMAKTIGDMNGARKQGFGYGVQVDIKTVSTEDKMKMALVDFDNIANQKNQTRPKSKCRRKIHGLMSLHRDCYDLKALNADLESKIINEMKANLQGAKNQDQKQYARWITPKLYKNNYGYHYPFEEQLKKIFPEPPYKNEGEKNEGDSQTIPISAPKKQQEVDQNSATKPVKKTKYTPKKIKQQESSKKQKTQSQIKSQSLNRYQDSNNTQTVSTNDNKNIQMDDEATNVIPFNLQQKQKQAEKQDLNKKAQASQNTQIKKQAA